MSEKARLLGFAFANADFLFEIDGAGAVAFAAGAAAEFVPEGTTDLVGRPAEGLFHARERHKFAVLLGTLAPGMRSATRLTLVGGDSVQVSMFHLPENGDRVSCALSRLEAAQPAVLARDRKTGLASRESFLANAVAHAGEADAMTLLNVPSLPQLCAELSEEKADALLLAIGKSLEKSGAKLAGRLSETSFGAIAGPDVNANGHAARVRGAIEKSGLPGAEIEATLVSLKGANLRPEQRMLALRYVVERFTKRSQFRGGDLGQAFTDMMDETQERARQLSLSVAEGDFDIAYQPIVDLKTRALSHFEALARFQPGKTAETVQFVEALGIADTFDVAVLIKVTSALETDKSHQATVAFNVSGHTIQSPESFALLTGLLERKRHLAPRLKIEITETAEISDLGVGAKAIDGLRELGYRVGLDDFGAGAATLNYLHAFHVDFVKFDGSLVKKLGASKRDDLLLTAMIKLCDELGVTTIAECLESEDDIRKARDAGFAQGQGYALGKPGSIPAGSGMPQTAKVGKRKGVTESWG
jgi:EAL domain-containing protein (putative c-di-GMP-specific phosphodiesterase class I)